MDTSDFTFFGSLVPLLPVLAVSAAGIWLCRSRLRASHPSAARFATIGWLVLMLRALVGQGVLSFLVTYGAKIGSDVAIARALTITNGLSYLLLMAALILFLFAILADRGKSEERIRAA